jgi:hypothetical protein
MSEYARAVHQLPVAPERREAEREAKRLFQKQKAELKDAILHDKRLSLKARMIGYEIADLLNFKTGYSWPSQRLIVEKIGCCERTVREVTKLLADEGSGLWFRRQLDGKNYCYYPRFERLKEAPSPVDDTGKMEHRTPAKVTGKNCRLSSLIDPIEKEIPTGACGQPIALPPDPRKPIGRMDDRRKVIDLSNLDEIITTAARAEGSCAFVYLDSHPWHCWNEYRVAQGLLPLPHRQHQVNGLLRAGADVPTLYPPGYGRHSTPRHHR